VELRKVDEDHPLRSVRFVYHDLPRIFLHLKRARLLPTMAYYMLWQWSLTRRMRDEARNADIVHHLTFCTPLCPGFWPDGGASRVIGPVGAPLVNRHFLPLFGATRIAQSIRGWLLRHLHWLPWLRRAFRNAAAVIPANSEARELLESMGIRCQPVMLDTGAPDSPELFERPLKPSGHCNFLYAGVLERRKGLELALRAFAKFIRGQEAEDRGQRSEVGDQRTESAPQPTTNNPQPTTRIHLTLLDSGPDRERLQLLAHELGIADHVEFPGVVPQTEVARHFAEADVFVFTSVRDTSGGVNLEAMASGLPILCIAHQGVGDITDDTCAIRVSPGPFPETIDALAQGMQVLAADPDLRIRLGENARRRALDDFSWEKKFERMVRIYEAVAPSR
jgi:glycosyltransferase involved in cell wall biosynthesis